MCEISKRHNFISHCLLWRFPRQWQQCRAESFDLTALQYSTNPRDGSSPSFNTELFTHNNVSLLYSAIGVTLKAPTAGPSVCCRSLFGFCSSLSSLFTISVQKCHSPLSWAARAFTHTHTQNIPNANFLNSFIKDAGGGSSTVAINKKCCKFMKHICDIIYTKSCSVSPKAIVFTVLYNFFGQTGSVRFITLRIV